MNQTASRCRATRWNQPITTCLLCLLCMMALSRPAAALTVGVEDTNKYGWLYGSNAHQNSYSDSFSIPAGDAQNLSLRVTGHDVDTTTEVEVLLNNISLGNLRVTPNNADRTTRFNIPVTFLQGNNSLEFRHNGPVGRWGVTNIKLEPVTGPTVTLQKKALDNTRYGYRFGNSEHLGVLPTQFSTSSPAQLLLSARSYDADSADKIGVYLNGSFLLNLPKTGNNVLSQSLMYKLGTVPAGNHTIEFRVNKPGSTWGVTDLGIWNRFGPVLPLTLNSTDNGQYGWRFNGANDHIDRVSATFPATNQNLLLTVTGHDIDFSNEVLVYLNGKRLTGQHGSAYLSPGPDRGLNRGNRFAMPAHLVRTGENKVTFRQRRLLGNRWGVTKIRVSRLSSKFTYTTPTTGKVGRGITISPQLKSSVANFRITPKLPSGLRLNKNTGRITGTPSRAQPQRNYSITGRSNGLDYSELLRIGVDPATVRVTVDARDGNGDNITYRFQPVAGSVKPTSRKHVVDWTLPRGRGLHALYVMVNDRNSGYTTEKIFVSSDTLSVIHPHKLSGNQPVAPTKPVTTRGTVRGWLGTNFFVGTVSRTLYWARIPVRLVSGGIVRHSTRTNLEGQYVFNSVLPGTYTLQCRNPRTKVYESCGTLTAAANVASKAFVDYKNRSVFSTYKKVIGNVKLADNSVCGVRSQLFDRETTAVVRLINAQTGDSMTGNFPVNRFGDYAILVDNVPATTAVRVRAACGAEQRLTAAFTVPAAQPANEPIVKNFKLTNRPPLVRKITATHGSTTLAVTDNTIAKPSRPSDIIKGDEHFLTKKGIESRLGGCNYYHDIGAVESCLPDGTLVGGINFADWKKENGLAPYNSSTEVSATFVNVVDLNLVRRHHAVRTNFSDRAYYVCNYPGTTSEKQADVDLAISNALKGKNLVACVAMNWSSISGVNNNARFIKFYVFGPDGELLPSVDLDGRGEKYLPGACVNCHGGESHAGAYPENSAGKGALDAKFLPFDVENLRFSSASGYRLVDQALAIRDLNRFMLNTGTTDAIDDLIANWYPSTNALPETDYVPQAWINAGTQDIYNELIKPYCRLCHVALSSVTNNGVHPINFHTDVSVRGPACSSDNNTLRNYHMPQSLEVFDRFWNDPNAQTRFLEATAKTECTLERQKNWPQ